MNLTAKANLLRDDLVVRGMKNETRLYNVLFPFWMLMLFPQMWLIVLPGNFIIDSIVLIILMHILKTESKKEFYFKNIIKIFSFGILSDILGSIYMLMMIVGFKVGNMGDELYITLPAVFISGIMIFVFNYFVTFKDADKSIRLKMALTFAIVTAPYTFMIPSSLLYR